MLRPDTTNDFTDAWSLGFFPSMTCGVWVGYDDRQIDRRESNWCPGCVANLV